MDSQNITQKKWHELFKDSKTIFYKAGSVVFKLGEPSKTIYLVEEGTFQITIPEKNFSEEIQINLGVGKILGEMGILNEAPRNATVQALTDGKLKKLKITRRELEVFYSASMVEDLRSIVNARLQDWPSIEVPGFGRPVRLININSTIVLELKTILSDSNFKARIAKAANQTVDTIHSLQFVGFGTIKQVFQICFSAENQINNALAIRLYRISPYADRSQLLRLGHEEVGEFKAYEELESFGKVAIRISDFYETPDLIEIAGYTLGEYIPIMHPTELGDTGIKKRHLPELVSATVQAWFIRERMDLTPHEGPLMGDLKTRNYVLKAKIKSLGEKSHVEIIDAGQFHWVTFTEVIVALSNYLHQELGETADELCQKIVMRGVTKAILQYHEKLLALRGADVARKWLSNLDSSIANLMSYSPKR